MKEYGMLGSYKDPSHDPLQFYLQIQNQFLAAFNDKHIIGG